MSLIDFNLTKRLVYNKEYTKIIKINIKINKINTIKDKIAFLSIFFIKLSIIINLIIHSLTKNNINFFENNFSKISLKVKGTGDKIILGHAKDVGLEMFFDSNNYPNEVYINGIKQNITVTYLYNFKEEINDIELIWYNNIKSASCMFHGGESITEIDFTNFNTSEITDMNHMFRLCSSLTSINFKNFDTSQVTDINCMFASCSSLTSLDLSMFNTSKVKLMHNLFNECTRLTSLDLSNFDTSQVTCMTSIFVNCNSLSSLNLSNFDFSNMKEVENFFKGCTKLEYINLANFDESYLSTNIYQTFFEDVPNNLVICIDKNKINNTIYPQLEQLKCHVIANDWKSKQKKIQGTDTCLDICNISSEYKYEYNGKCIKTCQDGIINNNIYICKCELEECLTCSPISLNKQLCTQCNVNYYPKENDSNNLGEYIKCYKDLIGYYLDKGNMTFKKCYKTCETCEIKGDNLTHNCLQCNSNYSFAINITCSY